MAPKSSLTPWLADFLWRELEAVTTWKLELNDNVKLDPESRFSDDGSNFRSIVSPPDDSEVQLIQVLSTGDRVIGIVSDGVTKLRAQLSDAAVATFEEETGEELSLEVNGDVFKIERLTVISTVLGPVEEFVQLHIDDIHYRHHFRKTIGQPEPIEDDENIQLLIDNIKSLRMPQFKEEPEVNLRVNVSVANGSCSENASASSRPAQTQIIAKRKRPGPTLDSDGFELEKGINLEGPMPPLSKVPRTSTTTDKRAQTGSSKEEQSKLLGLFRKPATEGQAPPAAHVHGPAPTADGPLVVEAELAVAATQVAQLSPDVPSPKQKHAAKVLDSPPSVTKTPLKANPSGRAALVKAAKSPQVLSPAVHRAPPSAQAPLTSQATSSAQTTTKPYVIYGRMSVPLNQRKVLDQPSSWIPPLPGRQFPSPNVPIELLTIWNAEVATQSIPSSQISLNQSSHPIQPTSDQSEESSDADLDELLSESEWPASQSPVQKRRIQLPPSSADAVQSQNPRTPLDPQTARKHPAESDIRGIPPGDLEVEAPRPLPLRGSPNKPFRMPAISPNDMRHPLPTRPSIDANDLRDESRHSNQESPLTSTRSDHSMQSQRQRFGPGVDPTTGLGGGNSPTNRNGSPAPSFRQSITSPSQSWLRTQARVSSQAQHESPALERQRRAQSFTSASLTGPLHDGHSVQSQRDKPTQRQAYHGFAHAGRSSVPSSVPQSQAPQQYPLPRSSASSHHANDQTRESGVETHQRMSQNSSWQPQAVSTPLQRPQAQEAASARDVPLVVSSQKPVDPAERGRLQRKYFMQICRRGDWLKQSYKPDRNGNLDLGDIAAQYNRLHPEDNETTLNDFTKLAPGAFPDERITPGMRFESISKSQASSQSPASVQKSDPMARSAQVRIDWLQNTYRPAADGNLPMSALIATYKRGHGFDEHVSNPAMLDAARKAFKGITLTADTRFIKVNRAPPVSRSSPSAAQNSPPSNFDGANDQMHDDVQDPRSESQQTNWDDRHEQPQSDERGIEPVTAMSRFCEKYLEIRPGNGNTFTQVMPQRKRRRRIDVLGWEL